VGKNMREENTVGLSAPAQQLLGALRQRTDSEFVFPADSRTGHRVALQKSWRAVCKAAKIKGLRIHDLRHGFASQLVSGGASSCQCNKPFSVGVQNDATAPGLRRPPGRPSDPI
jgi:integrase